MESNNTAGSTAVGTVGIPDEVKLKLEVDTRDIVARANSLEITNEMQNTQALQFAATLKAEIKSRKAILAPSKVALDATKAAYDGLVATMIKPLEQCAEIIGGKAGTFVKQENQRRAELQRQEDERVAAAQRKEDARVAELQRKEDARVAELQRKANEKYAAERLKAEEAAKAQGKTSAAPMAPPPVITSNKIIAPAAIIPMRTVAKVSAPAGTGLSTCRPCCGPLPTARSRSTLWK